MRETAHASKGSNSDQIGSFARQFGIGERLSVDVADASSGLMPDPIWKQGVKGEVWYPGDNVNMGIGQGEGVFQLRPGSEDPEGQPA